MSVWICLLSIIIPFIVGVVIGYLGGLQWFIDRYPRTLGYDIGNGMSRMFRAAIDAFAAEFQGK